MNKKAFFGILTVSIFLPLLAFAQLQDYAPGAPHVGSISQIIDGIELLTALVFSAIAVISFVIAGVMFLTAAGDPGKLKTARDAFFWGVAGVVVGIIAFSIIAIVSSFIA